jgi:hypothetical protein
MKRNVFNGPKDPAEGGMVAPGKASAPGDHGLRAIHGIDALHPSDQPPGDFPGSAPGIEHDPWLIADQGNEEVKDLRRIGRSELIDIYEA